MRVHAVLVAAILLFSASAQAQPRPGGGGGTVVGRVVAEGGTPLASVSVVVRSAADSAVVGGELTGPRGAFRVAGLAPGRYLVEATLMGYAPVTRRDVEVTADRPAVLGTLTLRPTAIEVEGVVARSERSTVVVAPDRTVYNTSEMPVAAGGVATDVLQNVPELQVDIEGNVELRGTAAQIYINGRPAPVQGESLQLFLQQFPADRIERVEVIPTPPARFEAEGAGGIVNIVLKQNASLGLSGNVFLNAGTRGNVGGGGRLTYQRGPLTLFGGGFQRLMNRDDESYDLRQNLLADPVTFLEQAGWNRRDGAFGNTDLTAELRLSERAQLWAEGRLFRRGHEQESLIGYTHMDASREPTRRYDRETTGESTDLRTTLAAGYRHTLEPRRHSLEAEVRLERGGEDEASRIRRIFLTPDGEASDRPVELTLEDEDQDERELSLRLDYVRPWGGEGQLEVGYRGDLQRSENVRTRTVLSEPDTAWAHSSLSGFDHEEHFHSVYLTLMRKFGPLSVQAGVRAEHADTRLKVPTGGSYDNGYASVFPSANLRYELSGGREVRFSYSKRIRRPGPWVLNPIDRSGDPLNRRVGNPDIAPQYNHSVSLEWSWSGPTGTLRVSPYYRRTVDDWTQIKRVDEQGISTVTWENLASVENYGTSVTANLRPVRGVGGFVSVSGYREVRDASNLSLDYSGADLQWSAAANLQARVGERLSLQAMARYRPAREVPQGRVSSMLFSSIGLRQQLWSERATLNLMVRDPFDLARYEFTSRDPSHVQIGRSDFSMRAAVLSFSYSFGRPPRGTRRGEQQEPGEEEVEAGIR